MDRNLERQKEIEAAVADVRAFERRAGVTREGLERIKARLLELAARADLFTLEDFAPPQPGAARNSCLYRLSEDADHRFALYVDSANGRYGTPAHDHTTWAVIVGMRGDELHSIHIDGTKLNFHMYGLALEQLPGRQYYKPKENAWAVFPPHSDIREARPVRA